MHTLITGKGFCRLQGIHRDKVYKAGVLAYRVPFPGASYRLLDLSFASLVELVAGGGSSDHLAIGEANLALIK